MRQKLILISEEWFEAYSDRPETAKLINFESREIPADFSSADFDYYLMASSLYSSKIEGNSLDVNSFFRNQGKAESPKKKEVEEVENLIAAYQFAAGSPLTYKAFLQCHRILSPTLLPEKEQGKLRNEQVGIRDSQSLRPVYLAVEPEFVQREMDSLFRDIDTLLKQDLSVKEVYYYASMIHLWTAMIHPFMDGNGRAARLLEKWFLASKLGKASWALNSEKYYWDRRPAYYQNISLGYNYYALHWDRCLPFLLMLAEAFLAFRLR
jgi:Fic family protein